MTETGLQPAVAVRGLSKQFGLVCALANIDLDLRAGEVHGLVGENGAGKSTLMKILAGIEHPTAGEIFVRGLAVQLRGPAHAQSMGIVMIHQELNLVDELTVADNIYLGREPTRLGLIDRSSAAAEARQLLASVGCNVDPYRLVRKLSIADKQMVEIAKALSYQARILIMDEPTAVLTQRETKALHALIGRLRQSGVSIVYISHILPEVLSISDRITVLRDGRVVATLDEQQTRKASENELARLMVGRPMAEHFPPRKAHASDVAFSVSNLSVPREVYDVSFEVRRGEIFGLAGLIGAGRTETAEAIVGLRPKSTGSIRIDGTPVQIRHLPDAVRNGIAYLSEDRKAAGLTLGMDIVDNTTMVSLQRYGRILLDRRAQESATRGHVDRLHIRAGGLRNPVASLSGGNQQKVLLAKWLETRPKVLIVDEPTRGVDIGAKEEIYRLLQQLAAEGMACVMISSEMNELLGMCHRIGVMRLGRLVTILEGAIATEQQIMHAAAGVESTMEPMAP